MERSTLKRALVSGVSVAVTAVLLGVSGATAAATINVTGTEVWQATGAATDTATATDPINLTGTLTIDDTGAGTDANDITGNGNLIIQTDTLNANIGASGTPFKIKKIDVGNIDIKAHNADNADVLVEITETLKTSGYLKLWSDETGNDGNVSLTVTGNLTVDNAEFTGSGGDNARGNIVLELKGGTNTITNGLILNASQPGAGGKATLLFSGAGNQEFTGKILGKDKNDDNNDTELEGDGILLISAGGSVTFKSEIGGKNASDQDRPLFKIQIKKNAAGTGSSAIFEQSVATLGADPADGYATGIYVGESDGSGQTYTATFDASNAANNLLTIDAIVIGKHKDNISKVIIQGNGKTVEQSANKPWGYTPNIDPNTPPPATITDNTRITDLQIKSGVTFNSHSTINAKNIIVELGTIKADFKEEVTVSDTLTVAGTAIFAKAIQNGSTPAVNITGNATFNAVGNTTNLSGLTLTGNPTINLGTAIGNGATVFGSNSANATFSDTGAGTITISLAATGLQVGNEIILLETSQSIQPTAVDNTKYSVSSSDSAGRIGFAVDNGDGTQVVIKVIELSAAAAGQPDLPTISGITQVSERMLNHAAAAIAARTSTRFNRDAKYAKTGFRATDFYRSREADDRSFREAGDRGFERTDDRSFREGDDRGFQKMDDRKLREGDERDFGKTDDRRLREADERKLEKTHERELREADERKLEKEHERKLDEKRHEHGDGEVHKPGERAIQKPVERPTGVSSGDSVGRAENAWFETFGDWIEQDAKRSSDNAYDVDGYNADIYGFAFGVDTEVTRDTLLGISFSYSNADVDWEGTSNAAGDVDHYQLTLYGEYRHDKFYAEGMLGYAMNDYEVSDFNGGVRNSEFDSDQYLAKLELGVPIYMGNNLFITPKSELTWTHLDIDNYTQTGTGNLLTVNPNDLESATATLGAEIHQRIKKNKGYIIPWAYAGVSYDLAGEESSVRAARIDTSSYYSLQGIDNEQFAGEVEFGVEYEVGQWSVGAKYAGRYKASRDTHSASLLAEYKF